MKRIGNQGQTYQVRPEVQFTLKHGLLPLMAGTYTPTNHYLWQGSIRDT